MIETMRYWLRTMGTLSALGAVALLSAPALAPGAPMMAATLVNAPRHVEKPGQSPHGHGGGGSSPSPTYGWSSSNWSGYALSNGTYHSITGQWVVPTVAPAKGSTYSSSWIGIDGFNDSDLIQTGTEQDYTSGSAQYYAWWEILPAAETEIADPVAPGDTMSASIVDNGNGTWTITLQDVTQGWTFTTVQAYDGPATSAEWIEEAPTIGNRIATLAHYGELPFNPGTVNGGNPDLVTSEGGVMIQNRKQVSTPSVPNTEGNGFNLAYGATAPAPPNS